MRKNQGCPMISQAISRRCPGLALLPWPGKSMGNGGTKCTFTDLHGEIIWKWYGFSGQKNQAQATPANTGGYLQTGHCSIANIQYTGMIIVCLSVLHGIILGVCAFHHPERDSFFLQILHPFPWGIYSNMFSCNASSMVDFVGLHGYPHLFTQITGNQNVHYHWPILKKKKQMFSQIEWAYPLVNIQKAIV